MRAFNKYLIVFCILLPIAAYAEETVKVTTTGSCAVEGYTGQQAQLLALRQARSLAVEKAAGVNIISSSLVTNGRMAGSFIRSLSNGYIVAEEKEWLPIKQYQSDPTKPPLIEYRIRLTADVMIPEKKVQLGLSAKLNRKVFKARSDKMFLNIKTMKPSRLAVFNLTADDRVMMLYPDMATPELLADKHGLTIPAEEQGELYLAPLPGHQKDTEAILIAALAKDSSTKWSDLFDAEVPLSVPAFFSRYARLGNVCEEVVLTYEVVEE